MRVKRCLSLLMSAILFFGILTMPVSFATNTGQVTRDTVLVLDKSGSMKGTPLATLKEAAVKFCSSVLTSQGTNRVALVFYDSYTTLGCDFTSDLTVLTASINSMYDTGVTNMISAVEKADELLKNSTASVRNLVLMTDGLPNQGTYSASGPYTSADYDDYEYANAVYQKAISLHPQYSIYTLGFFHQLQGAYKVFATRFLKDLQNAGYYEVNNVADLAFTFGEIASDIVEKKIFGTFRYSSAGDKDYSATYYYDDNYFAQKSNIYNDSLATMSLCFAMSAFGSNESPTYQNKSINAENLLEELGYTQFATNDSYKKKPEADTIGVLAASKKITANGNVYTIIAVAVRGGGYEREWASNFTLGPSGLHSGFDKAKKDVLTFLKKYISDNSLTGDVKLWITGYSRAAATTNLVAGALDNGESIGSTITLKSEDLFAYCFECPAGVLKSEIKDRNKYGNIFNIINPNDPVTKVAPFRMDFRRYGIDIVLPSGATSSNYTEQKQAMINQFKEIKSVSEYIVDDFKMKKIDWLHILPGGNPATVDDDSNNTSQDVFLDNLIRRLVDEYFVDRSNYYDYFEDGIRELCKAIYQDETKINAIIDNFIKKLKDNWGYLLWNYMLDEYGTYEKAAEYLVESFNEAGATGYDKDVIKKAAQPLMDVLLSYLSTDPNSTGTMIDNVKCFAQAHYSEVCLAWLQSRDKNYTTNAGKLFSTGSYRIIRINCPVDVSVFNPSGDIVASIISDAPQQIDGSSIIASINEDGEKIIYMPADLDYSLKITATDTCDVTYSVNEFSFEAGQVNRLVNYYSVPVIKNDVLSGTVPAYSKTDFQNGTENGTKTAYKLTDKNGQVLIPDLDVSGTDATNAYFKVSAVSEDINKGIATGSGVRQIGNFIEVEAVPKEGFVFEGWYQDNNQVSTQAAYRFCVKNDVNLIAKFKQSTGLLYALTITASKGGKIDVGTNGDFAGGTVIELKATPNKGYIFKNWTSTNGGVFSSKNNANAKFTMPENSTEVTAVFERDTLGLPVWAIILIILSVLLIAAIITVVVVLSTSKSKSDEEDFVDMPESKELLNVSKSYEPDTANILSSNISVISILSGSMKGTKIPIKDGETLNLGKDSKIAQVVFADDYKSVSRLHCTVSYDAKLKKYFVTDCSSNGTYKATGEKLQKGKRVSISPNSVIMLADANCSILLK